MFTKYRDPKEIKRLTTPVDLSRRNLLKGAALAGAGTIAAGGTMLQTINNGAKAQGEPIPVGGGNPITGMAASDGLEFMRGLDMACEEINEWGGILGRPVEPHHEDTRSMSADDVVPAFNRLVDRHDVHAIFSGYNIGSQNAEYEVVADAGIIFMNMNTLLQHHDMIQGDPVRYFGCFQSDPAEYWYSPGYLKFISWLRDSGQWTPRSNKLAILSGSLPYSIVIAEGINELAPEYGWEVAFPVEVVATPTNEWGPALQKVREADPAAIVNTHFIAPEIAACQNQFMQNPTNSLMYYQYGPILRAFTDIAQQNAEGVLASILLATLRDERGFAYDAKYRSMFGDDSTPAAGLQTYGMMHHYAIAASLAGGTGEPGNFEQNKRIAEFLLRTTFRSPGGTFILHPDWQAAVPYPDGTNDPTLGMPHLYYQIQDWTKTDRALIAPEPYAVDPFVLPPWMS